MSKRPTPLGSLVAAVLIGGFCAVSGTIKAVFDGGRGEYQTAVDQGIPEDRTLWIPLGIAYTVLAISGWLLWREIKRRKAARRGQSHDETA